ncbi:MULTISPECIES: NAD(P)-dependent oxidoreductase [Asticcacaulis]|uniref:NAD(P)-dependent oxidoreductase n=1 Tax=Asticcacaulis TaxID=76890 RepID=UPI001AEB7B1D|nr:NAD(P)-dependent oxidoreductase [Asticcacaulis sp. BE141]MBP2158394.1 3-hydroxyisobutyrate dehydrogenase/2-hydroxy-3-oxopropionate reductase [Asticcacaulis solisilvae]MDR6799439.1 3-hydroxyisobutyrate dehydrogenase/2-hydroxy-3-oxopropionate reductase [Asticcacaulis sp. BE141]
MKLCFAGLGIMGGPMAGHLIKAGHSVTGYNRTFAKTEAWAKETGGVAAASVAEAVAGADVLLLCVGRDQDVRETVLEALPHLKPGTLIIDHTTTSAKLARELEVLCASKGFDFYDAPVSGGQAGAVNGQLAIMVGGSDSRFAEVEALLAPYTKVIVHIGEAGAGQTAKMANQIAIAGVVQGVAEALHFTRSAGLDPDKVLGAISGGAAGSWQMNNRWGTMNDGKYDFGFAVDWMRKDLGIALDEARDNGAHLALTALVDQFYSEVQAMGGSRWDTSSLHARLEARRAKD